MANRYTYFPQRVINMNGVAVGASIYFYLPGTTTKISVYSDSALSTPLTNPVVVNAGAEVPPIYYSEPSARVYIVDAAGAVVSDDDPYGDLTSYNIVAGACFAETFGVVDDPNFLSAGSRIDQATALQAWLAYAASNSLAPHVLRPIRAYSSASLVYDPSSASSAAPRMNISLAGLTLASGASPGLVLSGTASSSNFHIITLPAVIRSSLKWDDDIATVCGGIVLKRMTNTTLIGGSVSGFSVGFQYWSEGGGWAYNTHIGGAAIDNRICRALTCAGGSSYANENVFIGGNYNYSSSSLSASAPFTAGIYMSAVNGGYTGHNNNRFDSPCFEMTTTSWTNVPESVPIWLEQVGGYNIVEKARLETSNGPLAHVRGNVNGDANATAGLNNRFEFQFIGGPGWTPRARQVGGAYGNVVLFGERFVTQTPWTSGVLSGAIWSGGPANGARIAAPLIMRSGSSATNLRELTSANQIRTNIHGIQSAGPLIGIVIDTTECKDFEFFFHTLNGRSGRFFIQGLDANGAILGATSTDAYGVERNIKFSGATYTTNYGGGYTQGSDQNLSMRVTVRDEVKMIVVGKASGTNNLVLNRFGFFAFANGGSTASTLRTASSLVVNPLFSSEGNGQPCTASANPGTAGTHGIYSPGAFLAARTATTGQPMGYGLSNGVTAALGVARADATDYSTAGQVITTGGNAYYVHTAGTTGTGTAPTGTTPDTNYTDGSVVFRYLGPVAAFKSGANYA